MSSATINPGYPRNLTVRDSRTLAVLFDDEASTALPPAVIVNPSFPSNPHYNPSELSHIKSLEHAAISLSLTNPSAALEPFNFLIETYPMHASAYNNRAQLKRILKHPYKDIKKDLQIAIHIAQGTVMDKQISRCMQKVLQNAWSQMGIVHMMENDQEAAVNCWISGAKFDSDWCRKMAAKHNPVAKMCGRIVKDAMQRELGPIGNARTLADMKMEMAKELERRRLEAQRIELLMGRSSAILADPLINETMQAPMEMHTSKMEARRREKGKGKMIMD
ncbi:hypothetical protein BZA77DRAFT_266746 [Pyronema omphalodes]|nr:hypothetical protein BZA77DRAFT_266746 [Pyronema omphalodes]